MNILFVNYGDYSTNSLNHIAPFANYLSEQGHRCIVAIPGRLETYHYIEKILFTTASYLDILTLSCHFPNGKPADIVHCWTPRINVVDFAVEYQKRFGRNSRFVVHMEDNEQSLLESFYNTAWSELKNGTLPIGHQNWEPMLSHPVQHINFLQKADAYTSIIDTLFEYAPPEKSKIELLPGIEFQSYPSPEQSLKIRKALNIDPTEYITVYSGGVSASNIKDIASLYKAVFKAREQGISLKLLKTGPNHNAIRDHCDFDINPFVIDCGYVPKLRLRELLCISDILIQPGYSSSYNDYRLPSKLPEYLAAGKPVITGKTNLGLRLKHLKEAYIVSDPNPDNLASAIIRVISDSNLQKSLARNGFDFSKKNFDISKNGKTLEGFYRSLLTQRQPSDKHKFENIKTFTKPAPPIVAPQRRSYLQRALTILKDKSKKDIETLKPSYSIKLKDTPPSIKSHNSQQDTSYKRYLEKEKAQISSFTKTFSIELDNFSITPKISIILPTFESPITLLDQTIRSVRKQIYTKWELCISDDNSQDPALKNYLKEQASDDGRIKLNLRKERGHISTCSNSSLKLATGDYITFLDHDDLLPAHALARLVTHINRYPNSCIVYSDEDKIDNSNNRHSPYFKPDWDPVLVLQQNYVNHLCLYKKQIVEKVGAFRKGFEGAQDWDFMLRASSHCDERDILHVPEILYHWRITDTSTASNPDNKSYALNAGKRAITSHLASIGSSAIIRSHRNLYHTVSFRPSSTITVTVLVENYGRNAEAQLIHKHSDHSNIIVKPLCLGTECNNAETDLGYIRNKAIESADSELICIVCSDLKPSNSNWLDELAGFATQLKYGLVAAKITTSDGHIDHCGLIYANNMIIPAFRGLPETSDGYYHRAFLNSSFSYVESKCIMFRKAVWREVGGFATDTENRLTLDIDFCSKITSKGYRNLVVSSTPLTRDASKQGTTNTLVSTTFPLKLPESHDPYYNTNLTHDRTDFAINVGT